MDAFSEEFLCQIQVGTFQVMGAGNGVLEDLSGVEHLRLIFHESEVRRP